MMNIPEDVRQTIADTLYAAAEDWALSGENKLEIDAALAWIEAPEYWEPVKHDLGQSVDIWMQEDDLRIWIDPPNLLTIENTSTTDMMTVTLPDGYALCRLVEVQP